MDMVDTQRFLEDISGRSGKLKNNLKSCLHLGSLGIEIYIGKYTILCIIYAFLKHIHYFIKLFFCNKDLTNGITRPSLDQIV